MIIINGLNINIEINLVPDKPGEVNIDALKAEIIREIENNLQKLARSNPEIQFDKNTLIEIITSSFGPHEVDYKIIPNETRLTPKQRKDYRVYEYKCFDRVYIPGIIPLKRSNWLIINGNKIKIADYLFVLFLRLVAELKKGKGGWVSIYILKEEGIIADELRYQIYSNLRRAIEGSLLSKNGNLSIQNDGSSNYRISTHPDFVSYNKEKLLSHPDHCIQRLAARLP
jgi:hypothetical protein